MDEPAGGHRAHEELRQSEERFGLLVASVKDYAIFMLDATGRVTTWNAGAEHIKGYKPAEIIGKHFSVFYPPEDVVAGKCEYELAAAERDGRFEDEGWRLRKDGSPLWANVVISALFDEEGTLVGFAKVTRDLTERVRAERKRLQIVRLEEAQRRKDELLAVMGHELRNPLAPMVTAVQMIKLRGGRATDKELAVLDRQLRHMTRLLDDLFDASRTLMDKIRLSPRVMEIGEVLANAADVSSSWIEERGHDLIVDVAASGLTVDVDPERIAQVFANILNNAAKYTPRGGQIRVRALAQDEEVHVVVEDTGEGIEAHVLPRIFDLFTQGDQGLDRSAGGLGIGLAIALKLAREHGGDIVAESDGRGRGSRFTVRLPRASKRAREISRSSELASPAEAALARRVLIVDDNVDSAEMMQALLEQLGHEARVALDGPSALEVCGEFKPNTVFLDIGLPGMSGYDVVMRMRKMPSCQKIPIVAVSGYARDIDRTQALRAGFSDHLPKPVDLNRLEEFVKRSPTE